MAEARRKPHILLFNPDQWRGDVLGHLGNAAAVTPNLDVLVGRDAVSFSRAFCQNPVCTPSRCSLMTGWYPHVRGHRTMFHMLRPDEPCLLKSLKDAGYFVWWGGKNDLIPAQNSLAPCCDMKYEPPAAPRLMFAMDRQAEWRGQPGSDGYYSMFAGKLATDPGEVYADSDWANVRGAIDLIHNPPADQPLCIYLPLTYPHPPYAVEEPWFSAIDRAALPPRVPPEGEGEPAILRGIRKRQGLTGWCEEKWDELRATYYGMCARVDHQFGLVVRALVDAGLYDDTLVVFYSDHGDFTGDYGLVEKTQNTFADCLTRVPLVVKPPTGMPITPGAREALVELVDIGATVMEIAGIPPDHSQFGRSLAPLLADPDAPGRDAVFCEGGRLRGETHAAERESPGSTDPANLYWPRLSLQRLEGPEHTKAVMCRTAEYKYVCRLYESDELYDLRADPAERENRIDDPALATVLSDLKGRLLTFYLETADVVPFDIDRRH
jgi:arylsulfatase A-like enzyme